MPKIVTCGQGGVERSGVEGGAKVHAAPLRRKGRSVGARGGCQGVRRVHGGADGLQGCMACKRGA